MIKPSIAFSQKEPNLVKFAVMQFKALFSDNIAFRFSLGEDSAYFMDGDGEDLLKRKYGGRIPKVPDLKVVRPKLNSKDVAYLAESVRYPERMKIIWHFIISSKRIWKIY